MINDRINGNLAVARAIGDYYLAPWVICEPVVSQYAFEEGDDAFILLCCDGVWDVIGDVEACSIILSVLKEGGSSFEACAKLRYNN